VKTKVEIKVSKCYFKGYACSIFTYKICSRIYNLLIIFINIIYHSYFYLRVLMISNDDDVNEKQAILLIEEKLKNRNKKHSA
jgi:hypothetical protein